MLRSVPSSAAFLSDLPEDQILGLHTKFNKEENIMFVEQIWRRPKRSVDRKR